MAVADYRIVTDMHSLERGCCRATGVPEVGARAAPASARNGQDLAMMNVETDITVGPILHWYAKQKDVLYALAAGDEPAACRELYDLRRVDGLHHRGRGQGQEQPPRPPLHAG